jgi:hypothetical protein
MGVTAAKATGWRMTTTKEPGWRTTSLRIDGRIEVGTEDGWLCFWTGGREFRVGPLTPEQAEKLAEDLGYDAVAPKGT